MPETAEWDRYGVTFPPGLTTRIERPLEYGDSRSRRIRELVRLGLAAEEMMIEHGAYSPLIEEREGQVKNAMEDYYTDG